MFMNRLNNYFNYQFQIVNSEKLNLNLDRHFIKNLSCINHISFGNYSPRPIWRVYIGYLGFYLPTISISSCVRVEAILIAEMISESRLYVGRLFSNELTGAEQLKFDCALVISKLSNSCQCEQCTSTLPHYQLIVQADALSHSPSSKFP